MALTINHNLMAMNTARNLNTAYEGIATSTRRLSSGLRVGTAADDAAGLAIREMMRADIAATNQGVRNANDAVSMIQTADGALQVIDEKLIRLKELATQAATGTYTSDQRMIIDSEFQAMKSEITRIAKSTEFNGIKVLDTLINGGWTEVSGPSIEGPDSYQVLDMISFGGGMYAAIRNTNGDEVWMFDGINWSQVLSNSTTGYNFYEKFSVYNNELYLGTQNPVTGAEVWRYNGASWSNTSAPWDQFNRSVNSMAVHGGNLYVGTDNNASTSTQWIPSTGSEVWSWDGSSWAQVNMDGFDGDNMKAQTNSLKSYNGNLYAGISNVGVDGEVWRYDGGVNWTRIDTGGLGYVYSMEEHGNQLFVGAGNKDLHSFDSSASTWTTITNDGFGNQSNEAFSSLVEYNGNLYASTWNDFTRSPNGTGGQVWELSKGQWSQVNNDGFGIKTNTQIETMTVHDGKLYAGTSNEFHINVDGSTTDFRTGAEIWGYYTDPGIKIHFGTGNSSAEDYYYVASMGASARGLGVSATYLKSQSQAQEALGDIDKAIVIKDNFRAQLGATQNRLSNTIQNLQIQAENLQAAESRISDVDVAQEMTTMVTNQILAQSATAMLAQANSLPKMALQLIQG